MDSNPKYSGIRKGNTSKQNSGIKGWSFKSSYELAGPILTLLIRTSPQLEKIYYQISLLIFSEVSGVNGKNALVDQPSPEKPD